MLSSNLRNMQVTVNTQEALDTLQKNRETHGKIVVEAREGYLKDATQALEAKMDDLRSGKVVALTFHLTPPQDYTKVYDVAIKMLEMHTGETIVLDGTQVKHVIMDDWDWMETFLTSNRRYSTTAIEVAMAKGLGL